MPLPPLAGRRARRSSRRFTSCSTTPASTRRGTPSASSARATRATCGITVSDEGPGIPADAREQVFEKFFRMPGREPIDDPHRAASARLPIARRLVEAQGRPHLD
jgi:signal transduction histidine kinase